MWFGPKGFASVVYGLLVLESQIGAADKIFHLVALTIVLSILAHSSTDIVVARAFDEEHEIPQWRGVLRRNGKRRVAGTDDDRAPNDGR
jgi:NhaP-type Na+/H+ or K+/H+ antiporter